MSSVDEREFFQRKTFYERKNTIKLKLCYEYCATCKKIGIKISDQKFLIELINDNLINYNPVWEEDQKEEKGKNKRKKTKEENKNVSQQRKKNRRKSVHLEKMMKITMIFTNDI